MTLRGNPSPPFRTNNLPKLVTTTSTGKVVDLTDYGLVTSLQSQLTQAQSDLAIAQASLAQAQAQIVVDATTISSLQSQVTSLQSEVIALQNQINNLGLDKIVQFKIIGSYSELGGGIYVPPSYDNLTVNYTPVFQLKIKTVPTYSTVGGGYP
jgi:hypothetical protein